MTRDEHAQRLAQMIVDSDLEDVVVVGVDAVGTLKMFGTPTATCTAHILTAARDLANEAVTEIYEAMNEQRTIQ